SAPLRVDSIQPGTGGTTRANGPSAWTIRRVETHGATVPQTRSSTGRSTPGRSGHSFSAPLPAAAPAVPDYKLRCDWTAPSHALASREPACRDGARIPMAARAAIPTPPLPTERLLRVAAVSAATSLPLASTRNCDAGRLHRRT